MSTEQPEKKLKLIILTEARPIKIDPEQWGVIARVSWHSGAIEAQAAEVAHITVRQHADGRVLIYGSRDRGPGGMPAGYVGKQAGYLRASPTDNSLVHWIKSAAEDLGMPELAQECIADLEPTVLE